MSTLRFLATFLALCLTLPNPAWGLRNLSTEEDPKRQSGLEEALRAKYVGEIPPDQNTLAALRTNLSPENLKQATWFLMAVGGLDAWLSQVRAEDWKRHLDSVLGSWVSTAEQDFNEYKRQMREWDLKSKTRRFAQSPFTSSASGQLEAEWKLRQQGAAQLLSQLPTADILLQQAAETLNRAVNDPAQQVRYFIPYQELKPQVASQHLVAFEDAGGIYIHHGFIDFVQKRPNARRLIAALLGHAGLERALLELNLERTVSHALAESLERLLLGEPLPESERAPPPSQLDRVIIEFFGGAAPPETVKPSQPTVPMEGPVSSVAVELAPKVEAPPPVPPARPRRGPFEARYTEDDLIKVYRSMVHLENLFGPDGLIPKDGLPSGLGLTDALHAKIGGDELAEGGVRARLARIRGAMKRESYLPTIPQRMEDRQAVKILEKWRSDYNRERPQSEPLIRTMVEDLFLAQRAYTELTAQGQRLSGPNLRERMNELSRSSGRGSEVNTDTAARDRLDAFMRISEHLGILPERAAEEAVVEEEVPLVEPTAPEGTEVPPKPDTRQKGVTVEGFERGYRDSSGHPMVGPDSRVLPSQLSDAGALETKGFPTVAAVAQRLGVVGSVVSYWRNKNLRSAHPDDPPGMNRNQHRFPFAAPKRVELSEVKEFSDFAAALDDYNRAYPTTAILQDIAQLWRVYRRIFYGRPNDPQPDPAAVRALDAFLQWVGFAALPEAAKPRVVRWDRIQSFPQVAADPSVLRALEASGGSATRARLLYRAYVDYLNQNSLQPPTWRQLYDLFGAAAGTSAPEQQEFDELVERVAAAARNSPVPVWVVPTQVEGDAYRNDRLIRLVQRFLALVAAQIHLGRSSEEALPLPTEWEKLGGSSREAVTQPEEVIREIQGFLRDNDVTRALGELKGDRLLEVVERIREMGRERPVPQWEVVPRGAPVAAPKPAITLVSSWKPGKVTISKDALAGLNPNQKIDQFASVLYQAYVAWVNGHNLVPPTEAELQKYVGSREGAGVRMTVQEFNDAVALARGKVPQDSPGVPPLYLLPDDAAADLGQVAAALLAQRVLGKAPAPQPAIARSVLVETGLEEKEVWVPAGWTEQRLKEFLAQHGAGLAKAIGNDRITQELLKGVSETLGVALAPPAPAKPPAPVPQPVVAVPVEGFPEVLALEQFSYLAGNPRVVYQGYVRYLNAHRNEREVLPTFSQLHKAIGRNQVSERSLQASLQHIQDSIRAESQAGTLAHFPVVVLEENVSHQVRQLVEAFVAYEIQRSQAKVAQADDRIPLPAREATRSLDEWKAIVARNEGALRRIAAQNARFEAFIRRIVDAPRVERVDSLLSFGLPAPASPRFEQVIKPPAPTVVVEPPPVETPAPPVTAEPVPEPIVVGPVVAGPVVAELPPVEAPAPTETPAAPAEAAPPVTLQPIKGFPAVRVLPGVTELLGGQDSSAGKAYAAYMGLLAKGEAPTYADLAMAMGNDTAPLDEPAAQAAISEVQTLVQGLDMPAILVLPSDAPAEVRNLARAFLAQQHGLPKEKKEGIATGLEEKPKAVPVPEGMTVEQLKALVADPANAAALQELAQQDTRFGTLLETIRGDRPAFAGEAVDVAPVLTPPTVPVLTLAQVLQKWKETENQELAEPARREELRKQREQLVQGWVAHRWGTLAYERLHENAAVVGLIDLPDFWAAVEQELQAGVQIRADLERMRAVAQTALDGIRNRLVEDELRRMVAEWAVADGALNRWDHFESSRLVDIGKMVEGAGVAPEVVRTRLTALGSELQQVFERARRAAGMPVAEVPKGRDRLRPQEMYQAMFALVVQELPGLEALGSSKDPSVGPQRLQEILSGAGDGGLLGWIKLSSSFEGEDPIQSVYKRHEDIRRNKTAFHRGSWNKSHQWEDVIQDKRHRADLATAILVNAEARGYYKKLFPSRPQDLEFIAKIEAQEQRRGASPRRSDKPRGAATPEDLFAEMNANVDLKKVLDKDGKINYGAFPTSTAEIQKLVSNADLPGTRKQHILGKLLHGRVYRYIDSWVAAKKQSGELKAGLEEGTPDELLRQAIEQNGGILRPDGLTFQAAGGAAVLPDWAVQAIAATGLEEAVTFYLELRDRRAGERTPLVARPMRIHDRTGAMQDPTIIGQLRNLGVEVVPLPATPALAKEQQLPEPRDADLMLFSLDATDQEVASWIPSGISPAVLRISQKALEEVVRQGIPGIELLIRLAERAGGRSLDIQNVQIREFQDYKLAVVTAV